MFFVVVSIWFVLFLTKCGASFTNKDQLSLQFIRKALVEVRAWVSIYIPQQNGRNYLSWGLPYDTVGSQYYKSFMYTELSLGYCCYIFEVVVFWGLDYGDVSVLSSFSISKNLSSIF